MKMRLLRRFLGLCLACVLGAAANAGDGASGGGRAPSWQPVGFGWAAGLNPNNGQFVSNFPIAAVVQAITCRLEIAEGSAATMSVYKAASGNTIAGGSAVLMASTSFNANSTAATNQTLTLVGGAADNLAIGDSIGVRWTGPSTTNMGLCTIWFTPL